jgi:hypothetical protein
MTNKFKTLMLGTALLTGSAFAQIPTNGLVGYYPFTGSANDLSGNNNNGTVTGAVLTSDRFGNVNSAYDFSASNDFIEVSTTNSTFNSQTYTYSFWTKNNILTGDVAFISRLNTNGSVYDNFCFFASAGNASLNYWSTNNNMTGCCDTFGLNMLGNIWKHITFTVDSDTIRGYLNGQLVGTRPFVAGINFNNTYPIRFGKSQHPYWAEFSGFLDDIRIYNRAITPAEVTSLYNEDICYQNITVTDTLLINSVITGFNPITYQNTMKVWPNPTNDHITIDNGNIANFTGYQIKITNTLGVQVFQSAITQQQFYIDLSTWTGNGIYFIHIIDAKSNTIDIKKIILN